jgi:hydroxyacylglutathione hydrolase
MENTMQVYDVSKVRQNVWAITELGDVTLYLIAGGKKALLIDTGYGVGELPEIVQSLTDLPLIVINTHAHPDHVCGNHLFDEIHIAQADLQLLSVFYDRGFRTELANVLTQRIARDDEAIQAWIGGSLPKMIGVKHGDIFELGQLDVEVIAIPGHTPGCIALLARQERLLFTGDMVLTTPIWLHLDEALPFERYLSSLQVLKQQAQDYDHILTSHGDTVIGHDVIDKLIRCTEQAIGQDNTGDIIQTPLGDGIQYAYEDVSILGKV